MRNLKPPKPGKYIDLLVDFAFKKIFASDPNKDLLIAFLNAIFIGRKVIVDLIYNKNEYPGESGYEGGVIFDLLCTGDNGERFLIEVQRGTQGRFKERALFYAARLISDQAPKGDRAGWAYDIEEVYLIALLEDFILEGSKADEYVHDVCLCNRKTGEIFYDKLGFTYIELRNFVKIEEELESDLDKWLYVLKNMSRFEKIPVYLRKPIFEKLFNIAEYSNLTKEEKKMYDSNLKYKWDNENVRAYEKELAAKEREIAVKAAVKEAVEKAVEKAVGKEQEKELKKMKSIARDLKKEGLSIEFIAKTTNLSVEEIEKL